MRRLLIVLAMLLISMSSFVFAQTQEKSFDLRESPNTNSKSIAQLPMGSPIMPIIRQNGWVKVADPKTGNVGWVQSEKLEKSPVVITQIIAGSSSYCKDNNCQFSFYSSNQPLTPQENDMLWQRIHAQKQYLLTQQAAMQKQMNEFMNDLDRLMIRSTMNTNNQMISNANEAPKKANKKSIWKFWDNDKK